MVSIIFKIHHMIIKKDLKPRKQRADTENFSSGFYNLIAKPIMVHSAFYVPFVFVYDSKSNST